MGSAGLYGTPATKLWMAVLAGTSILASAMNWKTYLRLRLVPHITRDKQLWRLATSLLAFPNSTELISSLILIYQLRVVERLFGVKKFASFLFVSALVGQTFELALMSLAFALRKQTGLNSWIQNSTGVAPGPYSLVFALLYQFYRAVPMKYKIRVFGVEVSDKWAVYAVAIQLALFRFPYNLIPILSGIGAGMVYYYDVGGLKLWRFPEWVNRVVSECVGAVVGGGSPGPRPRSAYPNVRRSGPHIMARMAAGMQPIERHRQQQQQQRQQQHQNHQQQQQQQQTRDGGSSGGVRGYINEIAPDIPDVSESHIDSLQGMFPDVSRDQIVLALQLTNNDPNRAVAILLGN